jgi:DNA-binding CsgD family transcriptional regulator
MEQEVEFRWETPEQKRAEDKFSLSPVEIEILQHMADGERAKKIPLHQGQTLYGIYNSLYRIRYKMKAKNLYHAIAIGVREGIIR